MSAPSADHQTRLLAELTDRVRALEHWRAHHGDLLDQLHTPSGSDGARRRVEALDPVALIEWVHRHVTPIIARPLRGELVWCPRWFEHPEAILRFEALRRAWEELSPQPGAAMSVWIRDHLDPCLRELTSPVGSFADCRRNIRAHTTLAHRPLDTLPVADPTEPGHDTDQPPPSPRVGGSDSG